MVSLSNHGRAITVLLALMLSMAAAAPASAAQRIMLGYYVPYDSTSWASLQTHVHDLDIVAAQWVRIDACGNLGSTDDQTLKEFARQNNVLVLPSLFTLSAPLNHLILTDEQARANAIQGIASYTVGEDYAGFDLDLEGVDPTDRDAFTAYVADLATALHEQNKMLTLALPAKDRDVTVGWSGAYDYAALGASADLVTIMAYEYSGPFSGPGSVAPYEWVARVMAFARSQIAPEKLVLGAAWYGYDWNTTSGGALSLGYPQALALAEHFGASLELDPLTRSATFAYETVAGGPMPRVASPPRLNHRVTERQPPPCDVAPPPAPTPVATPERPAAAGEPQSHAVWVEDSAAFVERVGLAERFGVAGIATWRLGQEDPRVWGAVQQWRSTKEE